MYKQQQIETLVKNIRQIDDKKSAKKTAYLDHPEVKSALLEKIKSGIPSTTICKTINDSGFVISISTFRNWKRSNIETKKKKVIKKRQPAAKKK